VIELEHATQSSHRVAPSSTRRKRGATVTSSDPHTATNQLRIDSEVVRHDRTKDAFNTTTVQLALEEVCNVVATVAKQNHIVALRTMGLISKAESPIEVVFWLWFYTLCGFNDKASEITHACQWEVEAGGRTYRLDFAVPMVKIAVELDGHDFHEKTKEQVTYRNMRDRDLQAAGWTVLHFSGSEVYRNGAQAATDVINLALERKAALGVEW
jgi:very-short-patch-repair endonuclease